MNLAFFSLYKRIILWILLVVVVVSIIGLVYQKLNVTKEKPQGTVVTKIKEVEKIKKVYIKVPVDVVTIAKDKVQEELHLTEEVKNNPNNQILTAGKVSPHDGNTEVTAVMDIKSGETKLYQYQEPKKFFSFKDDKEFGIRHGISGNTELYGRYTFMRIGNINTAIEGRLSTKRGQDLMIDVRYQW